MDQPPIIIPDPPKNPNPVLVYPIVTRFHVETNRPTKRLTLHVSLVSPLPKSYRDVFSDLNWKNAMRDEYHAQETDTAYLLLYADDIVITASSESLLQQIIRSLHQEFAMTDVGPLNYFLGISVTRDASGLFLSQKKYALEILDRAHMVNCNPSQTPIDTESKLGSDGDPVSDPTLYRSLAGYCVFLGNNLLSWSSKRQPTLSRSSAEAEYHGVANVVAETCWLRNLLRELHTSLSSATLIYCDNISDVRVLHVPSRYQFADIFTKGLPSALFEEFRTSLSVRCHLAPTAGEC
ncbi:ribonuclease H-like domain-containing protein [Tanacetum coccineum]